MPKLFTPGPVYVRPEILRVMASPPISHRSTEAAELQQRISAKFQRLMRTENTIVLTTSSGTGLMEAAVRSCTARKAVIFSAGPFGERWYDIARANGIACDCIRSTAGEPITAEQVDSVLRLGDYDFVGLTHNETAFGLTNPVSAVGEVTRAYPNVIFAVDAVSSLGGIPLDISACGIDLCLASTQKCLGLPPGMAVASVSDRAVERMRGVETRGYYFDLLRYVDSARTRCESPFTPAVNLMYAVDAQLDYILDSEGLEQRFARHHDMADIVRKWALERWDVFAAEPYRSDSVTCVVNTRNVDLAEMAAFLKEEGCVIASGYGAYRDKMFRVGHMGDLTPDDMRLLCSLIDRFIAR